MILIFLVLASLVICEFTESAIMMMSHSCLSNELILFCASFPPPNNDDFFTLEI